MSEFKHFLLSLGGLHDARVTELCFDLQQGLLRVEVDDIFFNSEGMPKYQGPQSGRIVLREISRVSVALQQDLAKEKGLHIYEFEVIEESGDGGTASLKFWPEGCITLDYVSVEFPNNV